MLNRPSALGLEAVLVSTIDIAIVAVRITSGVHVIQDILQVQRVVFAGGAGLEFPDQLVAPVDAD